jgi:hypothetical protein
VEILGQDYADEASFQKHLQVLRRMSGEQRLGLAFQMWQTACAITRAGIRAQHPEYTPAQVEQELARRIMLANGAARIITTHHCDS